METFKNGIISSRKLLFILDENFTENNHKNNFKIKNLSKEDISLNININEKEKEH